MDTFHNIYCYDPIDKIARLIGGKSIGKVKKILDKNIITQRDNGEIFYLPNKSVYGFDGMNFWFMLSERDLFEYKINGVFDVQYFSSSANPTNYFINDKWMVN